MPRFSAFFRRVPLLLLAGFISITCLSSASAQPNQYLTRQQRDRLYEELASEVAAIQQQVNLLKKVVKLVRPAVVHIEVNQNGGGQADETGSGVILHHDKNYFILTNRHLIRFADADEITIRLSDGRRIQPTRTWTDAGTDIAVMMVKDDRLQAARIGDSDKAEMGDYILAIGSPFGLNHSVTHGIISAKGRRDLQLATDGVNFQDFIQIDASINPGNSGGPLVNLRGEVIGINTAIASTTGRNEGVGFAIPINMALNVGRQLLDGGKVVRGYLGVSLDRNYGPAEAKRLGIDPPRGTRVASVTSESAADKAGVKAGDVILRIGDSWIDDDNHLVNQVSLIPVGESIKMSVLREGEMVKLTVIIGVRPPDTR